MPTTPSTQEHLDIIDIIDRYVIHKQGVSVLVQPSPVNFDLLSEREQDAMISTFAGLLNSLNFPIQVVVRTKRIDLSDYTKLLENEEQSQQNQFLRDRIKSYTAYIRRLTSRQDILDKKFYVVISQIDTAIKPKKSFPLFGSKTNYDSKQILQRSKIQLDPKVEQVQTQLGRLGVKVEILTEEDLVELYYNIYNPTTGQREHVALGVEEYTTPFVEPIPAS